MSKKALLFLKKKKQKDFFEFQAGELAARVPKLQGCDASTARGGKLLKFFWRHLISRGPIQTSLRSVIGTRVHKKLANLFAKKMDCFGRLRGLAMTEWRRDG